MVDIKGIDRVRLLRALWDRAVAAPFKFVVTTETWDEAKAADAVRHYIARFQGRYIQCYLKEDIVDPHGYDMNNGKGAFQRIVDKLKKE